jgi:hypothetical protein
MTREEMIDFLVDDDIDAVIADHSVGDYSYLADMLHMGMKGYDNFTLEELQAEIKERNLMKNMKP